MFKQVVLVVTTLFLDFVMIQWIFLIKWKSFRKNSSMFGTLVHEVCHALPHFADIGAFSLFVLNFMDRKQFSAQTIPTKLGHKMGSTPPWSLLTLILRGGPEFNSVFVVDNKTVLRLMWKFDIN